MHSKTIPLHTDGSERLQEQRALNDSMVSIISTRAAHEQHTSPARTFRSASIRKRPGLRQTRTRRMVRFRVATRGLFCPRHRVDRKKEKGRPFECSLFQHGKTTIEQFPRAETPPVRRNEAEQPRAKGTCHDFRP